MRVAFLADVHSNHHALSAVLHHLGRAAGRHVAGACSCGKAEAAVDRIFHLGDLVGYAADPIQVVQAIRDHQIEGVLGNHDWAALKEGHVPFNPAAFLGLEHTRRALGEEERGFLQKLPLKQEWTVDDTDVTLVHGSPGDPLWEYVFPEEAPRVLEAFAAVPHGREPRLLVLGHTHVPVRRYLPEPPRRSTTPSYRHALLNPGSVGQPRDGDPRASFVVLDGETGMLEPHRVPYDVASAARAIRDAGLPPELGERLFVGR